MISPKSNSCQVLTIFIGYQLVDIQRQNLIAHITYRCHWYIHEYSPVDIICSPDLDRSKEHGNTTRSSYPTRYFPTCKMYTLSMVEIGSCHYYWYFQIFQITCPQIASHKIDKVVHLKQTVFTETYLGKLCKRTVGKHLHYFKRLSAIGYEYAYNSSRTGSRKNIRANVMLEQCLQHSQMGYASDKASAQGESDMIFSVCHIFRCK